MSEEQNLPEVRKSVVEHYMEQCPAIKSPVEMMQTVARAHEAYVKASVTGADGLAQMFPSVPEDVFAKMIRALGWKEQRDEHLADLRTAAAVGYVDFVNRVRATEAKRIVDAVGPVVEKLAQEINSALSGDGQYRTIDARRLSEALAQLSGTLMQAAAVDGKMPEPEEGAGDGDDKKGKKKPWVTVNASGPVTMVSGDGGAPRGP